jgi:hypothetical protein
MLKLGSGLQLVGLTVVGLGLLHGFATGDTSREVAAMFIGAGLFLAGWLLTRRGGPGA